MQVTKQLDCPLVDVDLRLEPHGAVAGDEAKLADVLRQFSQWKLEVAAGLQVA